MSKENYIKICPKCGSTNWKMPNPTHATVGSLTRVQMVNNVHLCQDCDYQGIFPEVEESKVEEFRKQLKERK